jgi:uncharacterized membrane protein
MNSFGGFQLLGIVLGILGVVSTLFWMVVGWRAMRAHERIADATEELLFRWRDNPPRN